MKFYILATISVYLFVIAWVLF